jgi:hypothetical protein
MLNATLYRDPWKKCALIQKSFVLSFKGMYIYWWYAEGQHTYAGMHNNI